MFQLYHSTFVLSCHALNLKTNLFTLEELKEEFHKKILFGFIEGIWYLDIIYQGRRPEPYREGEDCDSQENTELAEEQQEADPEPDETSGDDISYRRDFFAMLEDVIWLGGALDSSTFKD